MTSLRRAAIVSPLRTPVGRFLGTLTSLEAGPLAAIIIKALVERSGVDPNRVDDVVFAQGYGSGEAPAIGRWSWLAAGLPIETPGFQLDRRCGSGLQAVIEAAMMVQTGAADCVLAGGVAQRAKVLKAFSQEPKVRGGGSGVSPGLDRRGSHARARVSIPCKCLIA